MVVVWLQLVKEKLMDLRYPGNICGLFYDGRDQGHTSKS